MKFCAKVVKIERIAKSQRTKVEETKQLFYRSISPHHAFVFMNIEKSLSLREDTPFPPRRESRPSAEAKHYLRDENPL